MDNWEHEAFRWYELTDRLEHAVRIVKYRETIDFWRRRIDYYNQMLGYLAGRRGDPEPQLKEEN